MSSNAEILNCFTQKLTYCKHKVLVNELIKYYKNDSVNCDYNGDEKDVIGHDYAFSDSVAKLVFHLRKILKEPRLSLRKERLIQNVMLASNYDMESLQSTSKDLKNWETNGIENTPKQIHTFVHEETYAIYENCFVCFVVDLAFRFVSRRINALAETLNSINKMLSEGQKGLTVDNYLSMYDANNSPRVYNTNDSKIYIINTLIKSKKFLYTFLNSPLYKECKKRGEFNINNLKPTNIINCDENFNYCYKFYNSFFSHKVEEYPLDTSYRNYIAVNLFIELQKCGFTPLSADAVTVANFEISFENITFESSLLRIILNKVDGGIEMTVKVKSDEFFVKYFISFNKEKEGYEKTFVISYEERENTYHVDPSQENAKDIISKIIKQCTFTIETSVNISERYCPICGGSSVLSQSDICECPNCNAKYHLIQDEFSEYLLIVGFPKQ